MTRRSALKPLRPAKTINGLVDQFEMLAGVAELRRRERLVALEAREERELLLHGPPRAFAPGDTIVLTATACRNWATVMGFPVTRSLTMVWTVLACDCALCRLGQFVCTDEVLSAELAHFDDSSAPALRHISVMQVKRKGELRADDGLSNGADQSSLGSAAMRAARGSR